MNVSFEINKYSDIVETVTESVSVNSLDDNLIDIVNNLIGSEEYISFDYYYENSTLMCLDRCYPYILRNGKYEWTVPYEEVSIRDFITTHNINIDAPTIKADINDYGGGDSFLSTEVIDWIVFAWPMVIDCMIAIGGLFTFGEYIHRVITHFTNKHNQLAIPTDVAEAINRKKTWKINELQSILGIEDVDFIEKLLYCCGFNKKDDSQVFTRNKRNYRKMRNQSFEYISECWGPGAKSYDEDVDEYWELKDTIQAINILMTDIKMHSAINDSDCFEIAKYRLNSLVVGFRCIRRGKHFQFIVLNEKQIKRDKDSVENELTEVMDYLESLLIYLKDKEERSTISKP